MDRSGVFLQVTYRFFGGTRDRVDVEGVGVETGVGHTGLDVGTSKGLCRSPDIQHPGRVGVGSAGETSRK